MSLRQLIAKAHVRVPGSLASPSSVPWSKRSLRGSRAFMTKLAIATENCNIGG